MKIARIVTSAAVIHTCIACSQSGVNAPEFVSVDVNLVLRKVEADIAGDAGSGSAVLHAQTALAFVRHIEFYQPEGQCAQDGSSLDSDAGGDDCEDKLRVEGPWVVDLMTGKATPSMDNIRVPQGSYRRVDVRFEDADKNAAKELDVPDELTAWTMVATGAYQGESAQAFDLRLKFNEDARFQSDSGIVVGENGAQEMVMALDVERWFSAVSLDECFDKERLEVVEGVLVIEDESKRCNAVENAIKGAMKHPNRLED